MVVGVYMDDIAELVSHQEYIKYKYHEGHTMEDKFYTKSYQSIVKNFASVHSNIFRIVVKYDPGSGKTFASLNAAIGWVDARRALGLASKIIIIGFTNQTRRHRSC